MPLPTIVLVVTALLVASAFTWLVLRKNRAEALQRPLAGVHDRALKRVKLLDVQPLSVEDRDRFANRWRMTQATFPKNPAIAVSEAETLVNEVMRARGYPLSEYNLGTADISVEHPRFVANYREAREIALAYQRGAAKTEDLKKAALRYAELFDALLEPAARKNRT
jgi:hypothetical protein